LSGRSLFYSAFELCSRTFGQLATLKKPLLHLAEHNATSVSNISMSFHNCTTATLERYDVLDPPAELPLKTMSIHSGIHDKNAAIFLVPPGSSVADNLTCNVKSFVKMIMLILEYAPSTPPPPTQFRPVEFEAT
jgi:hypothetical protein